MHIYYSLHLNTVYIGIKEPHLVMSTFDYKVDILSSDFEELTHKIHKQRYLFGAQGVWWPSVIDWLQVALVQFSHLRLFSSARTEQVVLTQLNTDPQLRRHFLGRVHYLEPKKSEKCLQAQVTFSEIQIFLNLQSDWRINLDIT